MHKWYTFSYIEAKLTVFNIIYDIENLYGTYRLVVNGWNEDNVYKFNFFLQVRDH